MGELICKSHNVSLLMYHFVFVAKYRRLVINEEVDMLLKETCLEISKRFGIRFLEIGTEGDHVHLLIQSVPMYSPTKIVKKVKSITAREIFAKFPLSKRNYGEGNFGLMVTLFLLSENTPMKMSFVNTLRIKVKMVSTSNCIRKSSKICNLPCFNKRAKRAVIPIPRFCAEGVKSFAFSGTACCGDFYPPRRPEQTGL